MHYWEMYFPAYYVGALRGKHDKCVEWSQQNKATHVSAMEKNVQ